MIGPIADLLHRQRGFHVIRSWHALRRIKHSNVALADDGRSHALCPAAGGVLHPPLACWGRCLAGHRETLRNSCGRPLLFGISEGAIFSIARVAGLAQWFPRNVIALATAPVLSLARVGFHAVRTSTAWPIQFMNLAGPPLWLR